MGLGQGSGGAGSIQIGSHPVGMGGSLRASSSVTVGLLLVLEGASVDFRLSFTSDATSEVRELVICLSDVETDPVAGEFDLARMHAAEADDLMFFRDTSVADELAEGYWIAVINEQVRSTPGRLHRAQDGLWTA